MTNITKKDESKKVKKTCKTRLHVQCRNCISKVLEQGLSRYGLLVGTHPIKTIILSLIFASASLVCLLEFREEDSNVKLWIEEDSQFLKDKLWVTANFPPRMRNINILLKGDDVLTKTGLLMLLKADDIVKGIYKNTSDKNWEKVRHREPILSLLEFWDFNRTVIETLTKDKILSVLNKNPLLSPSRNGEVFLRTYLSDITGNSTHGVVKAGIARLVYFIKQPNVLSAFDEHLVEDEVEWEVEFARVFKETVFTGFSSYFSTGDSYDKATKQSIENDVGLLISGHVLIFTYVAIMLGKFSRLQHKIWLAIAGIICVGLSIGTSIGLCSAAQVFYGPIHPVMPFLMLGIGVDDMFVVVGAWENVAGSISDVEPIPDKISRTMKHAGVAITVTSFTDICTFIVGATTVIPAFRAFWIYVGVGILMLYFYTSTLFVAVLTIDACRQRSHRDACLGITLPSDWAPLSCSGRSHLKLAISKFSACVLSTPGKIGALVLTFTMLGFGLYGLLHVEQKLDPSWPLPRDTDEFKFRETYGKYFPSHGAVIFVYVGEVNYYEHQNKLHELYEKVHSHYSIQSVLSWFNQFISYVAADPVKRQYLKDDVITNETMFYKYLKVFLNTDGAVFQSHLSYEEINQTIKIKISRFAMMHVSMMDTKKQIKAMDSIRKVASSVRFPNGFPETAKAFGEDYMIWQTDRIIGKELLQNLLVAAVCVFIVTLCLISSFRVSFFVMCCVAFTLIDICGFVYFWGLNIDMVISTTLVMSIGFAIDYSGHIGHAFTANWKGTRHDRANAALAKVGPAVLNGGISTFLAFCLLAGSESYTFQTFFKVFFLVVCFGLFHGMVSLPVVLSVVGPYENKEEDCEFPVGTTSSGINRSPPSVQEKIKTNSINQSVPPKDTKKNDIEGSRAYDNASFVAS